MQADHQEAYWEILKSLVTASVGHRAHAVVCSGEFYMMCQGYVSVLSLEPWHGNAVARLMLCVTEAFRELANSHQSQTSLPSAPLPSLEALQGQLHSGKQFLD